jgi:hypothetical protein
MRDLPFGSAPPLQLWGRGTWVTMVLAMLGTFSIVLMDGAKITKAIAWGLLAGPGWLAVFLTYAAAIRLLDRIKNHPSGR